MSKLWRKTQANDHLRSRDIHLANLYKSCLLRSELHLILHLYQEVGVA